MVRNNQPRDVSTRRQTGQPHVVLLGTSLQFSDQLVRVLRFEFPDVSFHRLCDPEAIGQLRNRPTLVILHEETPDLLGRIQHLGQTAADSLLAIACADASAFRQNYPLRSLPPMSLLQMHAPIDVWLSVLRLLLCGHVYVPAELLTDWATEETPQARPSGEPHTGQPATCIQEIPLTPRELQILPLIAEGKQNKTIAAELGLSEHTIKLHTHNIFTKLKVSNRTGAANWYLSQVEALGPGQDHNVK